MYGAHRNHSGKKLHGLIQGPGTGTSDSIEKDVPAGSFIMPADATQKIGEPVLAGLGARMPVRLSNGEYELPPEQVHAVGVQALEQMKGASSQGFGAYRTQPQPQQAHGFGAYRSQSQSQPTKGFGAHRSQVQHFAAGGEVLDDDRLRLKTGARLADEAWPQGGRSQSTLTPDPGRFDGSPAGSSAPSASQPPAAQPGLANRLASDAQGAATRATGFAEGSVKYGAGALGSTLVGPVIDAARQGYASARGSALENPTAARDAAGRLMAEGADAYGRAFDGAGELLDRAGTRLDAAIGATPRPAQPSAAASAPRLGARPSSAATNVPQPGSQAPAFDQGKWTSTGNGMAMRLGAGGQPEFSNQADALQGAQAMPAGGFGARRSAIPDSMPLIQRGSYRNIGNGIGGGISYGEPGDAARAIAQFDAANAIRSEQLPGVRVAGTGYQNRMTAGQFGAQRRQDRQDAVRTETGLRERELAIQEQRGIAADQASLQSAGMEQQKLEQQGVASRQKLMGDLARAFGSMANPPTVETSDGKGRPMTFEEWARPMLGGIGGIAEPVPLANAAPPVGTVKGGYRFNGGDPSNKSSWQKV